MVHVYLSRRNLIALLSKLDRVQAGEMSTCTIVKYDNQHPIYPQTVPTIVVTAVEDSVYYADRPAGATMKNDIHSTYEYPNPENNNG